MQNLDNFKIFKNKVLFRADLNVPVLSGKITDKSRIESIKKSISKLVSNKNKIFIISHFGRPKGMVQKKYSLEFMSKVLEEELNVSKVHFLKNFDIKSIANKIKEMQFGEICLFENIRFYPEEEKNDLKFIRNFCENFDIYVNDAFSASHRKHASIVGIPKFLPSVAGYCLIEEITNINYFFSKNKKPSLAIIGGSKISTKINLLNNLIKSVDFIFIGGAMANTFLFAKNINIGKSLCEKELSDIAISILKQSENFNCKIILPVDVVCSDSLKNKSNIKECDINNILSNQMILDIGSKTINSISEYINKSNMILWNGPLGVFEISPFDHSSIEIAKKIMNNNKLHNKLSIAGGGDTISAIKLAKAEKGFSYISKAGGAFLEWLEGKESVGIIALRKNNLT